MRGPRSRCRRHRRRSCRSGSREDDLYAPTPAHLARVPRAARRAAQRGALHAAEPARLGALSVHGRRRELVGRELRPRAPAAGRAGAEPRAPRAARRGRRAHDRRRQRREAAQRHEPARDLVAAHGPRHRRPLPRRLRSAAASCSSTTACRATGRRGAGSSPSTSRAARSRGARRRARATAIRAARATGPRSSPRAASYSTAARARRCCACTTSRTGARIATFDLPAGLHAGPISYRLTPGGKQFLVVAPGGHAGVGSPIGDAVIAYTLP